MVVRYASGRPKSFGMCIVGQQGHIPLIGVGGIFSAEDAYEKICAGASLVQLYTGLIYRGPGLPHRINVGLLHLLQRDGLTHLSQAVGRAAL